MQDDPPVGRFNLGELHEIACALRAQLDRGGHLARTPSVHRLIDELAALASGRDAPPVRRRIEPMIGLEDGPAA